MKKFSEQEMFLIEMKTKIFCQIMSDEKSKDDSYDVLMIVVDSILDEIVKSVVS